MNKSAVVIIIITALVFTALGFAVGQVVLAAGNYPGTAADPAASESYVDTTVGKYVTELQSEIDQLKAMVDQLNGGTAPVTPSEGDPADPTGEPSAPVSSDSKHVKVTGDGINVRNTAATGDVIASVNTGDELIYVDSVTANNATWYKIKLSNGTEGFIHSDYCSDPY